MLLPLNTGDGTKVTGKASHSRHGGFLPVRCDRVALGRVLGVIVIQQRSTQMGQETKELKSRVEAKKKQIHADIAQAEADVASAKTEVRVQKKEAIASMRQKLEEIEDAVKDGFEDLSEAVSKKLNEWLK